MSFTFHALPNWPYPETTNRTSRHIFRASWGQTLDLLESELDKLDADHRVIQAGFREGDIRLDGLPRADARAPTHPGVVVSFESRHGPLRYATDAYDHWQANARAIALGLEALRAVDRYGITRSGEQYTGWKQLTAGTGITTAAAAAELLTRLSGVEGLDDPYNLRIAYRRSLKVAHPDGGGTTETLAAVRDAARLLGAPAQ